MLETVNYYNLNKSNVFVLMLDASKAFDRVNYFFLVGRFITINRQRIYTTMYTRAEMKDMRSIH